MKRLSQLMPGTIVMIVLFVTNSVPQFRADQLLQYEYGSIAELRGIKSVFIFTGLELEVRNNIAQRIRKELPHLVIADKIEDGEIGLVYGADVESYYAGSRTSTLPTYSGGYNASTTATYRTLISGSGYVVRRVQDRLRILMSFGDVKSTVLERRPSTNFARAFVKAYKMANNAFRGRYYAYNRRTVHTWDFNADGTFLHRWIAAGVGTGVWSSERGTFLMSDQYVELTLASTAPTVGGMGAVVGGAADSVAEVRRLGIQFQSPGQGIVLDGIPMKVIASTVSVTSPSSGSTVSGAIAVTARGSNDVGVNLWSWSGSRIVGNITVTVSAVVGVQFSLDGANLGAEDTSAPYSVSWDTTTTSNGSHTLTARARDAAGNFCTSTVTVTVSNDTSPKGRKEASTGSLRCADMADFF